MDYTIEIQVRFSDTDAYGHVNNVTFFSYFETARFQFFKEHLVDLMSDEVLFLIAKAECEYKQPISLGDEVFVTLGVENIGRSSFTFTYNTHNGKGKVYATGKTVVVCYNAKEKRSMPIPESFLKALRSLKE